MITLVGGMEHVIKISVGVKTNTSKSLQKLEMIYDTGAGTTMLDRQFALDSGYKIKSLHHLDKVIGIGGTVASGYTIIPDLVLDNVHMGPVYAYVSEFHNDLSNITLAILGMNVISWFKVIQDCQWNASLERFDKVILQLEPKFDINDIPPLDTFSTKERGQRFGTIFVADSVTHSKQTDKQVKPMKLF